MIHFTLQTPSIPTLEETQAIVQEVHEDLQQLKPNAILETIRSWTPGLLSLSYRSLCRCHHHYRKPDRLLSPPVFKTHL